MEDILGWINEHNYYDVYSFDVFDTLLRRRIEPPALIKCRVAEHISELLARREIYVSPEHILAHRHKAEKALQQKAISRGQDADYCLDDVMAETLKALGANSALYSEEIVSYEIDLEKKATEPMPGAMAVLTYLQSIDKRVICLSDTYLSTNQIAAILEHHGLLNYIDKLYTSSDVGRRKETGALFQYVVEHEGSNIVHIGDDYVSDNIIPKKLAIRTLWLCSRSEQRRRRKLRKLLNSKNKMNYVNTIIRRPDRDFNALYRLGYDVFSPTLTVFVHSVAEQARKDGIEMLFFVARDGYIMKKVYDVLQRSILTEHSFPMGKYMCLSRIPIKAASLYEITYRDVSELYLYRRKVRKMDISFGDVLSSYGLDPRQFTELARRYGIDVNALIDDKLSNPSFIALLESEDFKEIVRIGSDQAKRLLHGYLSSIGLMGKRNVAVVDGNSEGITKSLLDEVFVNDEDYPTVTEYYLNFINLHTTDAILDLSRTRGVLGDWRKDPYIRFFADFGTLVELVGHPNHGLTVGYKRTNGKIIPMFKKTPQESQFEVTSEVVRGILAYTGDYSAYYGLHNIRCGELLGHVKANIRQWLIFPPQKDAAALQDLFVTIDWPFERNKTLIRPISFFDLITLYGLYKKLKASFWIPGALILAPIPGLNWLFYQAIALEIHGRKLTRHLTSRYPGLAVRPQKLLKLLKREVLSIK